MSQAGYSSQERNWRHFSLSQGLQSQAGIPGCVLALSWLAVCVPISSKGLSPCPSGGSILVNGTSWC